MEVINASGRRVSLLNDDTYPTHNTHNTQNTHNIHNTHNTQYHYRSNSSAASSPGSASPSLPQLARSDSSDSNGFASPSPLTPNMSYEQMPQLSDQQMQDAARSQQDPASTYAYTSPQPYPILQHQTEPKNLAFLQNGVPQIDPAFSTTPKVATKKNQYPCPVAKQYNCHDFFTTSGHAARHAKKHTGKKDAVCPECSKAFTRKDNMEQHRRTHAGGRSVSSPTTGKVQVEAAKERKIRLQQQRRRSRANINSDFALDPQLQSPSPSPYTPMTDFEYPQPTLHQGPHDMRPELRPELRRSSEDESINQLRPAMQMSLQHASRPSLTHFDSMLSPSLAPALDALALAASRQ